MFVLETVFLCENSTHFYQTGKTLSCNYLRRHKIKDKMEEKKRLMIGCGNHIESQLMIVKRPHTKDKRCCICISNQMFYTHPQSSHPQLMVEFEYYDYM